MSLIKKSKWAVVLVLATSMVVAGCSKTSDPVKDQGAKPTVNESQLPPYEVSLVFRGSSQKDLKEVEQAMSKITKEKMNATVKLVSIDSAAWDQQSTLMLASNEKVDLIYTRAQTYSSQISKGQLLSLDDLLKKAGPDILKAVDPQIMAATKVNGKTYGVPSVRDFASFASLVMRKDILDKYKIDATKIKSLDDLESAFKTIKEGEPNMTLLGPLLPGTSIMEYYMLGSMDDLGNGLGVMPNLDELKVVNWYETSQYAEALKRVRKWYQAGYISKDAATSKESGYDLVKANKGFGLIVKGKPGIESQASELSGQPMVSVDLTPAISTTRSVTGTMLSIAKNSENPERAMMLLNLLYSDKQLINLLAWGIEGKHYVKKSENSIDYPSGVTATNSGYNLRQGWMFGNQLLNYLWSTEDPEIWNKMAKFNKEAKKSKALGFTFNVDPVKTETAASTNVINQYKIGLETGTIDPEINLPKFIAALKAAGIDKIVAEKQTQLDEWAKSNK
ncbi:ABC transporter substrate-binding protein [Paenibacillus andongensis]|uniref:ABC transporter substrate-binding protein n=1 Tax=Paenibacillus andongensis TaxID=2975482 RepID=UPI0021BA5D5D|nr:ABC transporter substrate-binding protein [Paenibacillus andongensis]